MDYGWKRLYCMPFTNKHMNNPEYERRTIHFETTEETVLFSFDQTLLTRAFQNLIINAFVHGDENTEITLQISLSDTLLQIVVSDNGKGMTVEVTGLLFKRYCRGTNTEHKPEGTGLGLAIWSEALKFYLQTNRREILTARPGRKLCTCYAILTGKMGKRLLW